MSQTHPSRWEALTEVARRCVAEKQFDKAEEAFLAALREAEQFGDTDPRVAATLNALARVYHRRSKFFPAAALLHRLLGIKEREHGEEHPELAGILNNLAEMYSRLGDARQELELRERALRIRTTAGEADGGALDGLRMRIAELHRKIEEERAREEAARNAPPPRIPTGATDLPLILPTPVAPGRLAALAPAFAPSRKVVPAPAPAAKAVVVAPRAASPVSSPVAPSVMPVSPSPARAASAIVAPAPLVEPTVAPSQEPEEAQEEAPPTDALAWTPLEPPATPKPTPLAPPAPDAGWKPLAPQAPDSTWKPIAPPAPDSTWKPFAAPAPEAAWKPVAAPAPVATWPEEDGAVEPEPDEYREASSPRFRRGHPRAIMIGGLALAATVAVAVFALGRPNTADSAAGDVAAQPPARSTPRRVARPAPVSPAEAAALQAGLANLQQETEALPPAAGSPERPLGDAANVAAGQADMPRTDSAQPQPLRVRVPTLAIDNVTKSIEAAARARVDSITQAGDQQVYHYPGKQPRQ